MLDWEITEQEALNTPEEEPPPRLSRRGFYLVMGAMVVVGIAIAGVVSWRFQERDLMVEADLLGQIRTEESARLVGNRDRVPDLIAPDLPRAWRDRYLSQFRTPDGESRPVAISIEEVEYNGIQAQVWVRLGAQVQRRAYTQTAQGWRRVPLPITDETFGGVSYWREQGVEIYKQASDTEFAERLSADIPDLWEYVGAWDGSPRSTMLPHFVEIRPEELRPGLLESQTDFPPRIVVNSPQVVALPATWNLSGDSAVRLAVARAMWNQLPNTPLSTVQLPGGNRFVNALQLVLALQWALTPEEYRALTTQWHEQAKATAWQSPFFALTLGRADIDPFAPHDHAVALFVVADRLLTTVGTDPASVAAIRPALENAATWDDFFGTVATTTTLAFEATVRGVAPPDAITPAFTAAFTPPQREGATARGFSVTVAGHPYPIAVEALRGGADIFLPDGTSLNASCAPLFGELEIEGSWLEAGLRLEPTRIQVNRLVLPTTFTHLTPPPDTLAYLATYSDTTGSPGAGVVNVSALTPDGTLTPVLIPSTTNLLPAGGPSWGTTHSTTGALFSIVATGCTAQWYLRYVPEVGITGAWLIRQSHLTTYMLPHWDDVSGRGMLVESNSRDPSLERQEMPFWWLDEGEPHLLGTPDGFLPTGFDTRLAPGATSVAIHQLSRPATSRSAIVIVDPTTGTERAVYEAPTPDDYPIDFAFSGDGDLLYVAWQTTQRSGDTLGGSLLQQVTLATGSTTPLFSQAQGFLYLVAPDTQGPQVYMMTISMPPGEGEAVVTVMDTDNNVFYQGGELFDISRVLRCGGGGLLYLKMTTSASTSPRTPESRSLTRFTPDEKGTPTSHTFPLPASHFPLFCP